ncbi:MAG: sigma-70 family RNA polymerase sigma factor [Armatimonadetes bacterium]|nr:sigma-70 family RNA polymerase sigma factor [Armatimonadota bacterium]
MLWLSRGKRDRFERAARAIFSSVYSTALRLTRSREEAEDLTQEAMVRAFEAYERFDGRNFKAWMLRILTNLYINRYRKSKRQPDVGSLEAEEGLEVADKTLGPEQELFDRLLSDQVEEALASLPDEYRMAVVLSDIEGMSYDEIAKAADVPIGTVRSRLARGRAMLRKRLLEYAVKEGYLERTPLE